MKKEKFALSAVCTLIILLGIGGTDINTLRAQNNTDGKSADIAPELRFLVAGISDARAKLRCAQAHISYNEVTSKEFAQLLADAEASNEETPGDTDTNMVGKDQETNVAAWWYIKDEQLSMFVKPDSPRVNYEQIVANSTTAKIVTEFRESDKLQASQSVKASAGVYHFGSIVRNEVVLKNQLWRQWNSLDPRFYAFQLGSLPLDERILKSNPPAIYRGEETVDGSRCMKVQVHPFNGISKVYYVDVDHGFIIRRLEDYQDINGKSVLVGELTTSQIVGEAGIWLPTFIESKAYSPLLITKETQTAEVKKALSLAPDGVKIEDGMITFPAQAYQVKISDLKINCNIDPRAFILNWPIGTQVQDQVSDEKYSVESSLSLKK